MYYFLALLMGIVISIMVAVNGGLTGQYGVYSAAVIIHIAGLLLITAVVLIKRDRPFAARHPFYLYIGGAIGVFITIFNNLSFGRISVSAIMALGLLGQSVSGLIIDQYGLMGMPKHPFTKGKFVGVTLMVCGIALMIDSLEIVAVVVSFIAGVNIILSRTVNAKLSLLTNERVATFFNYVVGLFCALVAVLIFGRSEALFAAGFAGLSRSWWIYTGGIMGVCVVMLGNIAVVKVSAFYLTLLIFIGQILAGVLIDFALTQEVSVLLVLGGVLVAVGLCVNLIMDSRRKA